MWRLSAPLAPELLERSVELSLSGEAEALSNLGAVRTLTAGKSLGFEEARAREGIGRCLLAAGRAGLADGTAGQ